MEAKVVTSGEELGFTDIEDDKYPKSNRLLTAIVLTFMGAAIFVFDKIMTMFNMSFPVPYNYVLEFYNITLLVPAQTFPTVWIWLESLNLTSNTDINHAVSVVGISIYWFAVLWLYAIWVEVVGIVMARLGNYDRPDIQGAFKVYLLPALVALLFFLLLNTYLLYGDTSLLEL